MNEKKLLNYLKKSNVILKEKIISFVELYINTVSELTANCSKIEDDETKYMVNELASWLEKDGYELLYSTFLKINDKHIDKLNGFIDLYTYYLELAKGNNDKIIDNLFFIPGQFERDFTEKQQNINLDFSQEVEKSDTIYIFNTQGAFNQVPCLY